MTDRLEEVVRARGHEHVAATHQSTLEVTADDYLTPAGDCIVGIEAERAPADFGDAFVAACRDAGARIEATLAVADGDWTADRGEGTDSDRTANSDRATGRDGDGTTGAESVDAEPADAAASHSPVQRVVGRGDPALTFESDRSLVCRTSDYVDDRTVLVGADAAAADLDRHLVAALAAGAPLAVRIAVA